MDKSEVIKLLELYSNAIVAFFVFQGLAFCYTFGTNEKFNSIVKANLFLSVGLAFVFLATTLLGLFAHRFLRKKLETLSGEYSQLVRTLYLGKAVVIGLFGVLPLIVTIRFAI